MRRFTIPKQADDSVEAGVVWVTWITGVFPGEETEDVESPSRFDCGWIKKQVWHDRVGLEIQATPPKLTKSSRSR